ncbi:polysaccharide biosynthesis/export family protein [Motilimonas pumila]|uniref:Polysaccharide export protein n=1 Tax=Motilimonas pumila TaxID=2303987 RepID=A0A418YF63_9GAMM|nr:polysaccharide biosynthesis/export family protein [Motilimonas pumila]RJG47908.1 polysaccharide export protein [Motilimonas pumila]
MKKTYTFILGFLSCFIAAFGWANDFEANYKLGAGDTISIQVYGEPELSTEILLNDSGRINYPFLGRLQVKGLTVEKVKDTIENGLKGDYLISPNVHVSITSYRSFFINGEVKQPGGYEFQPGLTVNKAIALAGGFTERASKSDIILSSSDNPNRKGLSVELSKKIMPGDILTVEQSFF